MSALEFHLRVLDTEQAQTVGRWGDVGFSVSGMTVGQATQAVKVLDIFRSKLAEFLAKEGIDVGLTKHGGGEVIGPDNEGDDDRAQRLASTSFGEGDHQALLDELEDDDEHDDGE